MKKEANSSTPLPPSKGDKGLDTTTEPSGMSAKPPKAAPEMSLTTKGGGTPAHIAEMKKHGL